MLGVDFDEASVTGARKTYARCTNAAFSVGRCEDFQSADRPFDVIVSFETLEHLDVAGQTRFLDNLKRSLTPEGLLILSTPEKSEYGATRASANEFHKHELSEKELREILAKRFRHIALFGQRPLTVSGLWSLKNWKNAMFRFDRRDELFAEPPEPAKFASPIYLIAICSDRPIAAFDGNGPGSLYYDLSCARGLEERMTWAESVGKELESRTAWTLQLQKEKESIESILRGLRKEFEERSGWAKKLDEDLAKAREEFGRLQKEFEERSGWAKKLDEELSKRRDEFDRLKKEFEERTRWVANLEAELQRTRAAYAALQKETDERTRWAKSLEQDLLKARQDFGALRKEYEERTAWAISLRDENERERAIARQSVERMEESEARLAAAERRIQELQIWGDLLEREIRRITTSPMYRILAGFGILPKRG